MASANAPVIAAPGIRSTSALGRINQQTFIDTYSNVAFAKGYDRKTPITATDLLNDCVVPFYEEGHLSARSARRAQPFVSKRRGGGLSDLRVPPLPRLAENTWGLA
jgi:hypothetical protein